MRNKLKDMLGERFEFMATISRFGFTLQKNKAKQKTLLFLNILRLDNLNIVTNHCWLVMQKSLQKIFKKLNIKKGGVIKFTGVVVKYNKLIKLANNDYCYIEDYKLDKLKEIRLVS